MITGKVPEKRGKIERVVGDETPAEGVTRIWELHESEKRSHPLKDWGQALLIRFRKVTAGNVSSAEIKARHVSRTYSRDLSHEEEAYRIDLESGGEKIAWMRVSARRRDNLLDACIQEIQGVRDAKKPLDEFRKREGDYWNIRMVNNMIAGAWDAGFDRVCLRDVRTTHSYTHPVRGENEIGGSRPLEGADKEKAQNSMRVLYDATRDSCGFTGRDGDYWVLDLSTVPGRRLEGLQRMQNMKK